MTKSAAYPRAFANHLLKLHCEYMKVSSPEVSLRAWRFRVVLEWSDDNC